MLTAQVQDHQDSVIIVYSFANLTPISVASRVRAVVGIRLAEARGFGTEDANPKLQRLRLLKMCRITDNIQSYLHGIVSSIQPHA